MELQPTGKRVLIEMREEGETIQKGIIIQSPEKKRCELVKVLEVGSEVTEFAPGDTVLVDRYAGMEIQVDDRKLFIFKSEDLLAKCK